MLACSQLAVSSPAINVLALRLYAYVTMDTILYICSYIDMILSTFVLVGRWNLKIPTIFCIRSCTLSHQEGRRSPMNTSSKVTWGRSTDSSYWTRQTKGSDWWLPKQDAEFVVAPANHHWHRIEDSVEQKGGKTDTTHTWVSPYKLVCSAFWSFRGLVCHRCLHMELKKQVLFSGYILQHLNEQSKGRCPDNLTTTYRLSTKSQI